MENHIYSVDAHLWKSLVITEDELWVSSSRMKDLEKFEDATLKTGLLKTAYAHPLSNIYKVSFNEASDNVTIRYKNEKGKDKKMEVDFKDREVSNDFGEFLGDKLGLVRDEKQESQTKQLLYNLLYLLITVGATYFLATIENTDELTSGGSSRSRSRGAMIKFVVDTLGQKGVIAVGGAIALFLIYKLYKRYTKPAKEVLFSKR